MKYKSFVVAVILCSSSIYAAPSDEPLRFEIEQLQKQTQMLQKRLVTLENRLAKKTSKPGPQVKKQTSKSKKNEAKPSATVGPNIAPETKVHDTPVYVHTLNGHPESVEFFPTALLAENHQIVTYIAGTPVITAPYLGSRPAFDGSDYIVNISSINRDVRLMQQRRQLYDAFRSMGYPPPDTPIIALSGRAEPIGTLGDSYLKNMRADWDLGSAELDAAASLNEMVQAYISLAYDSSPSRFNNLRISNSSVGLGMGFINIGDLDQSPYYFTAGQLYVPFGRFSSSMVSAPLPMILGRTKARPFILGYKSQTDVGPFAALYAFKGDTRLGHSSVEGINLGYNFKTPNTISELGISFISSIDNSGGMQLNGSAFPNFGGFAALVNGSESVKQIPGVDVHGNLRFDRYILTAEWVGATQPFRRQDLSFDGRGAQPQAAQLEAAATFRAFDKPASFGVGYQWSKEALALRIPKHRISGVFSISIWKDTVESLEYRHDIDYNQYQYANGAAPFGFVNANTLGTGRSSDTLLAQIGVYF